MKSLKDLTDLKNTILRQKDQRKEKERIVVEIAMSTCGITAGAKIIFEELDKLLEEKKIEDVKISQTGCPGLCFSEPLVSVFRDGEKVRVYGNVKKDMINRIVEDDIINDRPITEWLINKGE